MIDLQQISKTYDLKRGIPVHAVKDVTLEIAEGQFLIVVGRSGSGKTTLLNLMAGLTRPSAGSVRLDSVDLWSLTDQERSLLRGQKIGFVFQFPSLLPSLTVLDNLALPMLFAGKRENGKVYQRANELLTRVGLDGKQNSYPRQLSAGQQQRVVVARALMNQPKILLADEPTSNLDEQTEMEIIALFRELHASLGITIVMVTHTRQLIQYGTRSIEMADGQINGEINRISLEKAVSMEASYGL